MADPTSRTPDERPPGSRVGHYEIVRELGRGGMGVVFEARDLKLERRVALKTPLTLENITIKRFQREARAASQLLHPHIVPVLDVFDEAGAPFMVMDYVEGSNLAALLRSGEPLPSEEILRHAEGLADALRLAHSKGVLHRDIKPGNILVDPAGQARLTDFGLARLMAPGDPDTDMATLSASLTATGAQIGTLAYMSPEQMLGMAVAPTSDVFSLGVVIYEMCTGRRAFPAITHGKILDAVLHHEPDAISRFNYDLPPELERIVRKALCKRPDERYQTAADLLADVRALRRRFETGTHSAVTDAMAVEQRRRGRGRLAGSAVLIAVIAAASAVGWKMLHRPSAPVAPLGHPMQLTLAEGWEAEPAISPDGGFVAYTSNQSGNPDVWITDSRGGEALQLTRDPAVDRSPAWFPDGSAVAFVSERNGRPSIWKTPRLGGAPALLLIGADYPAISPDGRRIAFVKYDKRADTRIAVAALDDLSAIEVLTGPEDGLSDHTHPRWSPDGETLCYADSRDLWLVPAKGGKPRRLTTDHGTDREPIWSVDGRYVYFSSLREGTLALWQAALAGGRPQRLTLGTGPERQPTLSSDGTRMAYSTFAGTSNIVLVDRQSGKQTSLMSLSTEQAPALAPDGSAVIFASNRRGRWDIWLQPLAGGQPDGNPRLLAEQPGTFANLSFSPDGRWVAYLRVHEQQRDIWVVSTEGALPSQITQHEAIDVHPAWSPGSDRIAFVSNRSGLYKLWSVAVSEGKPVGAPIPLTDGESEEFFPDWSPDGSTLAFVRDFDVWVVGLVGADSPRRVTRDAEAVVVRWEASGETLLVSGRWKQGPLEIRRISAETFAQAGPPLDVDFGDPLAGGLFDVSQIGDLLAFHEDRMRGDVWVTTTASPGR